jgi:hypothetical protein
MIKSITQKTVTKLVHYLQHYRLSCTTQIKHLACLLILLFSSMGWGQVNLYSFSSTAGTYTPITGGTVVRSGSSLDAGGATVTLPTAFPFNGASITSLRVNDDAYLALGVTSFSNSTQPIASSNAATGIIAALACDLMDANAVGTTPEIRWEQIGNEIIFQWNDFARYISTGTSSEIFDFQIRLNTSNGQIVIVYSNFSTVNTTTTFTPQVGLRGSTSADFNARRLTSTVPTATPSWSNTVAATTTGHNVRFTSTSPAAFPSTGLTYTWTPPVPCSGSPTAGTISTANQYLCSGATVPNLVNTGFSSGVTGITFQWQQSTDDATWATVVGGSGATTATYTPPVFAGTTIYYRCNVTCANGGGAAATPSVSINPPANPATQVTNAVASSISYTGFTTTWVNGNGNRRVVYISDTAIVDPSNSTGAAAPTVNTVYAGSGQQIVFDGTGTTVTVTGLTLGTTYYVKVIEYTRCGTTTFDNYYNTTAGTNAISVSTSSISPTPWSEGFATGVATFPNWQTTTGGTVGTATGLAALSSNYWYVNLYGTRPTAAVTTPIIGSIPSNYRFVVKYNLTNFDSPYAPPLSSSGNFIVAISTDNGSSYTDVETIANNAVAGWQEYVLNLSAYTSQNIRIRLTGNRTSGDYHLAFDNFSVEAIPSCLPPSTLVLSSITNNSASLSWTASASAPGSGYDVYYSTTNTAPTAGTTPSANVPSGTTYAYNGLTANTTYYSWVRSNCGSGDVSTWVASASFTTQCDAVSVPYSQDFESVTTPALPNCTTIENAGLGNNWKTASPPGYGFTTKCLNYSYNGDNAANAWFFTAGINLTAGTSYRISYNYGTPSTTVFPENLKVAYGVSALSTSMTTTLATHTNILDITAPLSTVDFTPGTTGVYYFGFNAFSDADMNQLYVDNISIKVTPNTWTGTTSNSWNTASNWSLNTVPSSSDDVLISSNGSNAPVMDVDVTIPAGKSLTITGGTLTIAPGKVLTIAGTANFGGRPVTFKSNATGTAMLGIITGTLTGATSVTVERFIPAGKRAFRLLSPAVTTTGFISGNWQEQTHITGGASGGFDATETNNPSMYTYNNQAAQGVSGWTPIPNTNNTNLIAGVGYRVLIRGDKTPTNITSASADAMNAAITLSATGTLKTGTVPLSLSSTPSINNTTNTVTNGFSLVGNPYQSAVDWNAVTKTDIDVTYWAWDPNMGTSTQRGRYVSFNGTTNSVLDGAGSPLSYVGQFIQPGQAFFVKNTGSSAGTLTFEEADKATTSANVFRTANTPSLGVALYDPNELAIGGYPIDATKAVFSAEYTNELGLGDATKLEAAGENIAWFRNNTKLAIDAAAPVTTSDELAMKTMRLGANKNYTFKIQTTNFDNALTPYLVDTFLNTQTEIATSQAYLASFATTSNQASYSEDRFKIVFQTSALTTDDFVKNIKLYPNPAKAGASFYVDGITEATVSVYNVVGQNIPVTVMSQGNAVQVTPSASLSKGVYLVSITTQGITKQVKWIVE